MQIIEEKLFFLSFFLKKIKNNDCKLLAKTKTISLDELLHSGFFSLVL